MEIDFNGSETYELEVDCRANISGFFGEPIR